MKSTFVFLFLTFIFLISFGQDNKEIKISQTDSIKLEAKWNVFYKSLIDRDTNTIKENSLRLIHCIDCFDTNGLPAKGYFVPVDTFIIKAFSFIPKSRILKAIMTKKHFFTAMKSFGNLDTVIYEVWFVTAEKDEIAKGHEGQSHSFEFVKVDGQFKFFGLTSVP